MPPQLKKVDSGTSRPGSSEGTKTGTTSPPQPEHLDLPIAPSSLSGGRNAHLEFHGLPPFPGDVPAAPLLRISLNKLLSGAQDEVDRLWKASCELGFFYLDLREGEERRGLKSPEQEELCSNVWDEHAGGDAPVERNESKVKSAGGASSYEGDAQVDGEQLLSDAEALFKVGEQVFALPVDEKVKYDLISKGSYFGYKGYGQGAIDKEGTKDRNEFYNVSHKPIFTILSNVYTGLERRHP